MDRNGERTSIILLLEIKVAPAVKMILITNLKEVGPALISLMIHLLFCYLLKRMTKTNKSIIMFIIHNKKFQELYYQ
jgi:mannose/fructose/N-acetylgalactosamine-specific phosphotransferase system component IID